MSFFTGRKERYEQVPTLTGGQGQLLNQLLGNLGPGGLGGQGYASAIQNLLGIIQGSPESYRAMEAPARQAFSQQTIPDILERFSGAGARSSSGLQQTLGQAGRGLETDLAAQRANLQQNAVQQLLSNFMGQSQLGLGTQAFENVFRPSEPGFLQQALSAIGPGVGALAGGYGSAMGLGQILKLLMG